MNGEDFEHKLQKLLLHNGFKVVENNDVKVTTVVGVAPRFKQNQAQTSETD